MVSNDLNGFIPFRMIFKIIKYLLKFILNTLLACLLLLRRFSRVRLCMTPWTAAYQTSPSMGFSRQEHWSGLPFPSPMHESGKWKWSRSVILTLRDPMDWSLPGSSIHGIFWATVLEWDAIAFSEVTYWLHTNSLWKYDSLQCGGKTLKSDEFLSSRERRLEENASN